MNTKQKAEHYASFFETKKRDNGDYFTIMRDDRPDDLYNAVYSAHGDRLPDDFIFSTFHDLLDKITEYTIESMDDLENYRHEIVENYVDIYTHNLLNWLASDINNLEYLAQAAQDGWTADDGVWQLLARAQYYAIDSVMDHVMALLENDNDE